MKQPKGLTSKLLRLILQAGLCSLCTFLVILQVANFVLNSYFSGSDLQQRMIYHRVEKFVEFVSRNNLAATDYSALQKWCDKQPLVLMEIYRDNILLFNSNYYDDMALSNQNIEIVRYPWYSYYDISFADGDAELLIYSDESYAVYTMLKLLALLISVIIFISTILLGIRITIHYIYQLSDDIGILGNGDLSHPISIKGNDELTFLASGLETARKSLAASRKNEEIMIKNNNEMITGLSHDLRTPLTKIMLCVEIIQSHKYRDEQELNEYLTRTYNNALQLKAISEHILQYSLSQNCVQNMQIRPIGFQGAFFDIISEIVDYFICLGFEVVCDVEWFPLDIEINDINIRRILDNIVSNIEKYADIDYPVYITSICKDEFAGFEFRNKKKVISTLTGHHVGLVNLQNMLAQMGGTYNISDNDYFVVQIAFHICDKSTSPDKKI